VKFVYVQLNQMSTKISNLISFGLIRLYLAPVTMLTSSPGDCDVAFGSHSLIFFISKVLF
jgi:hypothetical protein